MIGNQNEIPDTAFLSSDSVEQQHETHWAASERPKFVVLANTL